MRDILFSCTWIALLILSFAEVHLAVLAWIWVAMLSPSDLMYGVAGTIPLNKLVAVSAGVGFAATKRKRFYVDSLLICLAIYSTVLVLSYMSAIQQVPKADFMMESYWKIIVLVLLITCTLYNRRRLHAAALAIALAFGFYMVKEGLIFLLTAGGHQVEGSGSTGDNNGLALAILMTIPFLLYLGRYTEMLFVRAGMYVTAGLGYVTVVATYSRGAFLGMIVLMAMSLRGSRQKLKALLLIVALAAVVYALMPQDYVARVDTIQTATDDSSFMGRLNSWKINFLLAVDHPLLGGGPYASLSWPTWATYGLRAPNFLMPTPLMIDRSLVAHSIYFQALGDTGFLGLLLFLSLIGVAFLLCARVNRISRKHNSLRWAGDLATALQSSFIVFCVTGAALTANYLEFFYILLALTSALHRTVVDEVSVKLRSETSVVRVLQPALGGVR